MAGVVKDLESSRLDEKDKVLFRYLRKVNHEAASITRADVEAVRAAGWTDDAIYDAVTVCALFNFYNRWCDAMGARDMPAAAFEMSGKRMAEHGYLPARPKEEK